MRLPDCRWPECPGAAETRGLCPRHYAGVKRRGELHLWPRAEATPRPWPLGPLLAYTGLEVTGLAERLGVTVETVEHAQEKGLTDAQADHWATELGRHASNLFGWDAWWQAGITVGDDVAVNSGGGWRHAWLWAEGRAGVDEAGGRAA